MPSTTPAIGPRELPAPSQPPKLPRHDISLLMQTPNAHQARVDAGSHDQNNADDKDSAPQTHFDNPLKGPPNNGMLRGGSSVRN